MPYHDVILSYSAVECVKYLINFCIFLFFGVFLDGIAFALPPQRASCSGCDYFFPCLSWHTVLERCCHETMHTKIKYHNIWAAVVHSS